MSHQTAAEDGPDGRLAQVVLDQLAAAPQVDLMLPLPLDPRLRQVYRSLNLHPEQQTTLGDWGRRLGVSEKTLSRLFLSDTGLTFRAWRQRLRLLSALPALEQGERVTDVYSIPPKKTSPKKLPRCRIKLLPKRRNKRRSRFIPTPQRHIRNPLPLLKGRQRTQ